MKRVLITYPGAFHHAMNRGYDVNDIFAGNQNKAQFLELLEGTAKNAIKVCTFARTAPFLFLSPLGAAGVFYLPGQLARQPTMA